MSEEQKATGTEADVIADITRRQLLGIVTYSQTVRDNGGKLPYWLNHAYEESLDLAIYLKRAIEELAKAGTPIDLWNHVRDNEPRYGQGGAPIITSIKPTGVHVDLSCTADGEGCTMVVNNYTGKVVHRFWLGEVPHNSACHGDDDLETTSVEDQVDGLLEGLGATEDIDDVRAMLQHGGLSRVTADKVIAAIIPKQPESMASVYDAERKAIRETAVEPRETWPEWATNHVVNVPFDFPRGACLPTRDGRRCGNATVLSAHNEPVGTHGPNDDGLRVTVLTDAGNEMTLTRAEVAELFHPAKWITNVGRCPGVRVRKGDLQAVAPAPANPKPAPANTDANVSELVLNAVGEYGVQWVRNAVFALTSHVKLADVPKEKQARLVAFLQAHKDAGWPKITATMPKEFL
jgi:hypothetical protein